MKITRDYNIVLPVASRFGTGARGSPHPFQLPESVFIAEMSKYCLFCSYCESVSELCDNIAKIIHEIAVRRDLAFLYKI